MSIEAPTIGDEPVVGAFFLSGNVSAARGRGMFRGFRVRLHCGMWISDGDRPGAARRR